MKIGDRVKVFDGLLFKDDISTPLSTTMVSATIIGIYKDEEGRECVDVRQDRIRFPHLIDLIGEEAHISRGHFLHGVKTIS